MKNILKYTEEVFESIFQALNDWFDGKKIIIAQLCMILISVMGMYTDYGVVAPAIAAAIIGAVNMILKAIASGKPLFNTGYQWDTWFFWINIISFGTAVFDLWLELGVIGPKWNLVVATILIVIRTFGMNQSAIQNKYS